MRSDVQSTATDRRIPVDSLLRARP